jgi:hypothetical protein
MESALGQSRLAWERGRKSESLLCVQLLGFTAIRERWLVVCEAEKYPSFGHPLQMDENDVAT